MKLTVTVCNVCQEVGRETKTYRVANGGRSVTVDLCSRHSAPLDALLSANGDVPVGDAAPDAGVKATRKAPAKRTGKPPARKAVRVMTLDEIEASKSGS